MSDWTLTYEGYVPDEEGLREALCTLGNGFFATRGAAPETGADGVHYPGTYLAGGYNRVVSRLSGCDIENEDLVNAPNWLPLTMRAGDGPWFRADDFELLEYRQELRLDEGVLERNIRFRDSAGRTTRWWERRLVSMADAHVAALSVEIIPEDWTGTLTIRTALDGSVTNRGVERYLALDGRHLQVLRAEATSEEVLLLHSRTNQSRRELAQAARTRLYRGGGRVAAQRHTIRAADWIAQEFGVEVKAGQPLHVEKVLAFHTSRDPAMSEPCLAAVEKVEGAEHFDDLRRAHTRAWYHLWQNYDVALEDGDSDTRLRLRLHTFHLLQTLSPHTTAYDVGAPARGWHGEAYRGHIFWDELFILPVMNLHLPDVSRALLLYRYRRLPAAREAARRAGHDGAMFPWQSGSDGREESQRLHLNPESGRWIPDNSHRQRHINAAVAYNVWLYYQATDDHEFLYFYGTEMLVEIARFWANMATWDCQRHRYVITGVMGPDEFHTAYPGADPQKEGGVDNNAYTNIMAAWCLMRACDAVDLYPKDCSVALLTRMELSEAERQRWEEISRLLYVPFHEDGIISQFEGYESLEEFDWAGYREKYGDIRRLDRILEAEGDTPNRYKVSKQADVLMLFYLFSAEDLRVLFDRLGYSFEPAIIPKNIDYYLQRTSHGSTLSLVVHAWVLARSNRSGSWKCFQNALDSDIADVQGGTTPEGIHLGAMTGTLDLVHRCYLGVETRDNVLHLDPAFPHEVGRIRVVLRYRRHKLEVEATQTQLTVRSRPLTAPPITIAYRGRGYELSPGLSLNFELVRGQDNSPD